MYKGKRILGLIPARGGSKRFPGKNIQPLLGKPLIAWTIEQALYSKCLDKVIVSTDSEEISAIANKYDKTMVCMRPNQLATDESKIIDTIIHVLDFLAKKESIFDYLVLLEPTSPLRAKNDIDKAIALLSDNEDCCDSVVSCGKVTLEHPFMAKSVGIDGFIRPFIEDGPAFARMQDIPKEAYIPYGVLYISKVEIIRRLRTFYSAKTMPYYLQRWQNYELDDACDFLAVENILRKYLSEVVGGSDLKGERH